MTIENQRNKKNTHLGEALGKYLPPLTLEEFEKYLKESKGSTGFDARNEEYVDMVKSGIIDPTLVTRTAVQNAASIAGLLLTTECAITDKPEPPSAAPAMPGGDMGGMGGMGGMM